MLQEHSAEELLRLRVNLPEMSSRAENSASRPNAISTDTILCEREEFTQGHAFFLRCQTFGDTANDWRHMHLPRRSMNSRAR